MANNNKSFFVDQMIYFGLTGQFMIIWMICNKIKTYEKFDSKVISKIKRYSIHSIFCRIKINLSYDILNILFINSLIIN